MMKPLFLMGLVLLTGWAAAGPPVFYVAPDGNDAWSGSLKSANGDKTDGPVATLTRARDLIREKAPQQGALVYVRGGNYFLREPLRLEKADSGTKELPVIWQVYPGETARLVGGALVTGFTPHKDAILKADLAGLNLPAAPARQLFVDSVRQTLARWPNKGEGEIPGGGWAFVAAAVDNDKMRSFAFAGDRPGTWTQKSGIEVSIWPNYNWWQTIAAVEAVDAAAKQVRLTAPLPYSIEPGRRYFFQNILEELDAPGEWYVDDASKTLYFWPSAPMEKSEVIIPVAKNLLVAEGVAHLAWLGFTMEAAQADAVVVKDCRAVTVGRCVVRNTGEYGVQVLEGARCKVAGCDIYATGRGAIVLQGGDRKTLKPAGHVAINNHIHHIAELYQTYETGVNISGVGNRVANNLIHDLPHIGILLNGNDHMIEYNEIHHVCLQGSDNGGFYMGRDWTQQGNVIRCNKFHDIYGFGLANLGAGEDGKFHYESPHQAWGVYLDDCTSGVTVSGNLFYRVPLCGVMIGGGRDNKVDNNVFVDCVPALHIDDRWDAYCWDVMQQRLEAMNYKQPPYSERYPALLQMGDDPRRPANNSFTCNIVAYSRDDYRGLSTTKPGSDTAVVYNLSPFDAASTKFENNVIFHPQGPVRVFCRNYKDKDGATIEWQAWQEKGFDKNSVVADPMFVSPETDDFTLGKIAPTPENKIETLSPATERGFAFIPDARIGLYQDEFRASWPPPAQQRRDDSGHKEWLVTP